MGLTGLEPISDIRELDFGNMDTSMDDFFTGQYYFVAYATFFDIWTNMTEIEEEKTRILFLSARGQNTENAPVQVFQLVIVSDFNHLYV